MAKQALYGYRRAPQLFQEWLAEQLLANGWLRSKLDPCLFKEPITGSLLSHHADDLLVAAAPEHYQNIWKLLQSLMELKQGPQMNEEWMDYLGRQWQLCGNIISVRMKETYFRELLK